MSRTESTTSNPMRGSSQGTKGVFRGQGKSWEHDEEVEDGGDALDDRRADSERRAEQRDSAATAGGQGDEPRADAAEIDDQLMRAEGEGMVTEHAKVSATEPGPEPLPEPGSDPEPDHGPGEPDWDGDREPE